MLSMGLWRWYINVTITIRLDLICATCPSHVIILDLTILITLVEEYKLWSSLCSHFIPLWSKCIKHPVLENPQSTFLSKVRDLVSGPHKTTSKIIVLYTVIFMQIFDRNYVPTFCWNGRLDCLKLHFLLSSDLETHGMMEKQKWPPLLIPDLDLLWWNKFKGGISGLYHGFSERNDSNTHNGWPSAQWLPEELQPICNSFTKRLYQKHTPDEKWE
jgi:hypothetical protein